MVLAALELLVVAAASVVAFAVGFRVGRARHRATLPLFALGLLAALFGPLGTLFPPLLAIPLSPLGVDLIAAAGLLFLGVGAGVFWERPGLVRGLALAFTLGWGVLLTYTPIARMVLASRFAALPDERGAAHVLQTTQYTCAAASAATLLQRYGVASTEAEMARLCRTSIGTSGHGIRYGLARKLAARPELRPTLLARLTTADLLARREPLILQVIHRRLGIGHAIVFLGADPEDPTRMRIADPLDDAVLRLDAAAFDRRYRWRYGLAVGVERR